jgi:AAA ATPase domain
MKISVADFRCFHDAQDIEVRPINILVGENSAGKSSFLAAVRFVLDLFRDDTKASFNKDPFYLGSFDQIAHFRGGRFGRAKEFSFGFSDSLDKEFIRRRYRIAERPLEEELPDQFSTKVSFTNNRSQPAISQLQFSAGNYSFDAAMSDLTKLTIRAPGEHFELPSNRRLRDNDPLIYDLSSVDFALRDFRFASPRSETLSDKQLNQVQLIHDIYLSTRRVFPRDVYASAPVRSKPARTYNPGESNGFAFGVGNGPQLLRLRRHCADNIFR